MQYAMDLTVCQRLPRKLHIKGIFHAHLPEKGDTGGGATADRSLTCRLLMRTIEAWEKDTLPQTGKGKRQVTPYSSQNRT